MRCSDCRYFEHHRGAPAGQCEGSHFSCLIKHSNDVFGLRDAMNSQASAGNSELARQKGSVWRKFRRISYHFKPRRALRPDIWPYGQLTVCIPVGLFIWPYICSSLARRPPNLRTTTFGGRFPGRHGCRGGITARAFGGANRRGEERPARRTGRGHTNQRQRLRNCRTAPSTGTASFLE